MDGNSRVVWSSGQLASASSWTIVDVDVLGPRGLVCAFSGEGASEQCPSGTDRNLLRKHDRYHWPWLMFLEALRHCRIKPTVTYARTLRREYGENAFNSQNHWQTASRLRVA